MKKRILSVLMALCMVLSLAPTMAFAAANNIAVSDATYHDSGALKSMTTKFDWTTGAATSRLVLMTEKLRSAGEPGTNNSYGDFTDFGYYGNSFNTFNEVLSHDATNETFGIISYSDEKELSTWQTNNTITFNFNNTDIPLNQDGIYYVYLWTYYRSHYYPDNLFYVIGVKDGAVKYTVATGTNEYDESDFEQVESQRAYAVTVTAGANMTKTDASGAASQTELKTAMTPVVYTANEGYYFPENYAVDTKNGIMVERLSETQIRVYGTPSADATITLAAPTAVPTYTVSFDKNGGTGEMASVTGVSGEYTLPACEFTAPAGKVFDGWQVGEETKAVGDKITVTADTEVTALWEKIAVEEVDFGYAYDVQRSPAYPSKNGTMTLSSPSNPVDPTGGRYGSNEATHWELTRVGRYAQVKEGGLGNTTNLESIVSGIKSNYPSIDVDNVVIHKLTRAGELVAYGVVVAYNAEGVYAIFFGDNLNGGAGYFLSTTAFEGSTKDIITSEIATDYANTVVSNDITVTNDGNGTAIASLASAEAGTEITLTATPNSGYQFKEWQVVSGGVTITENKFTMPAEDVEVKACFEAEPTAAPEPEPTPSTSSSKPKYPAKLTEDADVENGNVSFSQTRARAGRTVTITVTPDDGYALDKLVILDRDGDEVTFKDNGNGTFTFTMPKGGVEVEPFFEKIKADEPAPEQKDMTMVLYIDQLAYLLNDTPMMNDVAPTIRGERTMLPIRVVAEALGATVAWSEADQTVTIVKGDLEIVIYIGESFALVNGSPVELDSAAFIANDRTYLPLRFVAENLGATVNWDGNANIVTITHK